jgi:type IV pilus assembly protein PilF
MNANRLLRFAAICICGLLLACGAKNTKHEESSSPAEINAQLGLNYMRQGNIDMALEKLNRAMEQDPKLPAVYHYFGLLYQQLASVDLADQNFKRALSLAPQDASIQNNYGAFLCEQRRYPEAEKLFLSAGGSPDYKRSYEAFENAALCALRIPDRKKAEEYFRRALEISPVQPTSLFQMAKLSYENRDYLKARAFMQRYHAVTRPSPETLVLGMRIERALGDEAAAEGFRRQLSKDFPDAEETKNLGKLLSK